MMMKEPLVKMMQKVIFNNLPIIYIILVVILIIIKFFSLKSIRKVGDSTTSNINTVCSPTSTEKIQV